MKLWKYIHFTEIGNEFDPNHLEKEPLVWAVNSPGPDYVDITTNELKISREIELIKKRKIDGVEAYQSEQAKMRVSRLENGLSHALFKVNVYDVMGSVIKDVESGDWLNAHHDMQNVTSNAVLTQEMIDGFNYMISRYLCDSGMYDEFIGATYSQTGVITMPT